MQKKMEALPSKYYQRFNRNGNINDMEISLEDNLDIEVEHFSDCLELKSYLEGDMTIKYIIVTCEESA